MANEKRLIDANELLQDARRATPFLACLGDIVDLEILVNDQTTVDAVEVAEYDAVVSKLENLLCHATGGKYSKAGYSWEDMERMVTDYIGECCEEAVAVEVVRCKDCKWWKTNGCWYHQPGRCVEREPLDFCSDGERKDNE